MNKGFIKVATLSQEINFVPLSAEYFNILCGWFNTQHVQEFYSLRSWTLEEVTQKFTPRIYGKEAIYGFIIFLKNRPIGYVQYYAISEYPWPNQNFLAEVIQKGAGVDLFIGERDLLRKGVMSCALTRFLNLYIWPKYKYCVVDPDVKNKISELFFKKLGFEKHVIIDTQNALGREVELILMIKKAPEEGIA